MASSISSTTEGLTVDYLDHLESVRTSIGGPTFTLLSAEWLHVLAAARSVLEASEAKIKAIDAQREAFYYDAKAYKELYEAGCKNWDPVYQVVLNERDTLRKRISELEGALDMAIDDVPGWVMNARATLRNREDRG